MANYPYLPIEEFKSKLLNSIFQYASELFDKNPNPNEDELKSINEEVNKRLIIFVRSMVIGKPLRLILRSFQILVNYSL